MFDEDELNVWEFIRPELFRSRNLAWGSIYIDLESGKVNFVQRWKYEFVVAQGVGRLDRTGESRFPLRCRKPYLETLEQQPTSNGNV